MTKFHINKHGVPAPCKAIRGNCPLGGEGDHYDTKEQAQISIDEKNANKYGLLGSAEERSPSTVENYDEDLEKRLFSNNVSDRMYAARRGYGADILASDDNKRVRLTLAEKGHAIETLAHDEDPEIRAATFINNQNELSDSAIESLSNDEVKFIRRKVASSGKYLDKLSKDKEAEVRGEVALKGHNLDELSNDESSWVRERVARNGAHLDKFANDKSYRVRAEVAIQGKHLDKLVNDEHPEVRRMVAMQGHGLTQLQNDENKDVRQAVEYAMNPELYNNPERSHSYSLRRKYVDSVKGVQPIDYAEYARNNNVSISEAAKMRMKENIEVVNNNSLDYRVEFENEKPIIYKSDKAINANEDGTIKSSVKESHIERVNRLIIQYNEVLK